jgi:hypothetical protein
MSIGVHHMLKYHKNLHFDLKVHSCTSIYMILTANSGYILKHLNRMVSIKAKDEFASDLLL